MKSNRFSPLRKRAAGRMTAIFRTCMYLPCNALALSRTPASGMFDADKVVEIKAAIAGGLFEVNAGRVADGLIDSLKDALQKRE